MIARLAILGLFALSLTYSQNGISSLTFGGSGADSLHGITVDAAGNIYVVGTTYSSDLPLRNAYQPVNSGTQVTYSTDSGATWKPLSSPLSPGPATYPGLAVAVDAVNSSVVYAASGSVLCKSSDAGNRFQCADLASLAPGLSVYSLIADPRAPSVLYLNQGGGGLFKSTDGGQTFVPAARGIVTAGFQFAIAIDPFHSNTLFAWTGKAGYVSHDGAATWSLSTLPYPASGGSQSITGFFFDAATPGTVYGPGFNGDYTIQKSIDGGYTWSLLPVPFSGPTYFGPDPRAAGTVYALARPSGGGSTALWKSVDGGISWSSSPVPQGLTAPLVFDPANPQVVLAGDYGVPGAFHLATYRSADGGLTWSQAAPRVLQPVFAATPGLVYAVGQATSDAFLAKFLPDGKTLVFATYFGGSDIDTGNAIALDPAGNIWIAGNTSSMDFPVTAGAFQPAVKGPTNGFVAGFTSDGQLLAATCLGGASQDTITGLAVAPSGNPWVAGSWASADFPFTSQSPAHGSGAGGYLGEFDPTLGHIVLAMPLDGQINGQGIAVDAAGNVIVTGSTTDPAFPATVQPLPRGGGSTPKAFVLKLDPAGATIYSTVFGGSRAAPAAGTGIGIPEVEGEQDLGVAVAVDSAGNAYVTGSTSATDFPTTAGAYQVALADRCPFPALSVDTGLIGVISDFIMDDSFVVKLSPDGSSALYSTLVGGQCYDHPTGVAVDASGRAAITGETDSFDYPLSSPVNAAPALANFASFLSVLGPSGSDLDFSTYLSAGSAPLVVAGANGSFLVAGATGPGSQTLPISGAYITFVTPLTHGYLAVLTPPAAPPPLNLTQALNAFSMMPGPIAPGEILSLTLPGFSPPQPVDLGLIPQGPMTTSLAGAQVSFNGRPAFLISVLPGRIVAIAPTEIAGQSGAAIQVTAGQAASNVLTAQVAATAVGLLSADGSGAGAAYANNADGSVNSPANPAAAGSAVTVYFTGGGLTHPSQGDGVPPAGVGSVPVAGLSLFPLGGLVESLPGFVPGVFAYTIRVAAPSATPAAVSTEPDFYQTQSLSLSVR